jgi:hypothetical protein
MAQEGTQGLAMLSYLRREGRGEGDGLPSASGKKARAMDVVQHNDGDDDDDVGQAIKKEGTPVQTPFFFFLLVQFVHTSCCLPFPFFFFFFFFFFSILRCGFAFTSTVLPHPHTIRTYSSLLHPVYPFHTLIVIAFPFRRSHSYHFLSLYI